MSIVTSQQFIYSHQQVFKLIGVFLNAFLFSLAFPGGTAPWLGWLVMIPLGVILHNENVRQAFLLTLNGAWLGWILSTWWLIQGVAEVSGAPGNILFLIEALFCLFCALPYAIAGMITAHFGWFKTISGAFKAAIVWTAVIGLFPHLLPGNLTHSQAGYPLLIQTLDITGIPGLFFLMHWFSWLIVVAILNWRTRPSYAYRALSFAVLIFIGNITYGAIRLTQLSSMDNNDIPVINVGMIQPNLQVMKRDRKNWLVESNRIVDMSQELVLKNPKPDIIIFPEIPPPVSVLSYPDDRQLFNRLIETLGIPIFLTSTIKSDDLSNAVPKDKFYNAVELIKEHQPPDVYMKQILLPFGEFLPGEESFPWLRKIFPNALQYIAGEQSKVFELSDDIQAIPLICYESLFPKLVRAGYEQGGNIIINPSNDSWFGHSSGAAIHLALAMFRSVEFRMPMVRVTNGGISAVITPLGQIAPGSQMNLFEADVVSYQVEVPTIFSLYAYTREWFLWLSCLLTCLFIMQSRRQQKKNNSIN